MEMLRHFTPELLPPDPLLLLTQAFGDEGTIVEGPEGCAVFRFIMILPFLVIKALCGHLRRIGKCGKIKIKVDNISSMQK